jgi:hypothetical protein
LGLKQVEVANIGAKVDRLGTKTLTSDQLLEESTVHELSELEHLSTEQRVLVESRASHNDARDFICLVDGGKLRGLSAMLMTPETTHSHLMLDPLSLLVFFDLFDGGLESPGEVLLRPRVEREDVHALFRLLDDGESEAVHGGVGGDHIDL